MEKEIGSIVSKNVLQTQDAKRTTKEKFKCKFSKFKISPASITKTAMLTAISFLLYAFVKVKLPLIFPSFLELQISELPALLAGFSMGPVSGCIVIVLKCLLKLPMSSTAFVGELTDIIIGICFVLPSSLIYKYHKSRKGALCGLGFGILVTTFASVLINRFISIPIYLQLFFHGDWDILLGVVRPLYANITQQNFYAYYLGLGILPFNLMRGLLTALITFFVYKRLSNALHWEFRPRTKQVQSALTDKSIINETIKFPEEEKIKNNKKDKINAISNENVINAILNENMMNTISNENMMNTISNENVINAISNENMKNTLSNQNPDNFIVPTQKLNVFLSKSLDDTLKFSGFIAGLLKGGEIILLEGELGAGKTTFTKGLAKALCIDDEVTSPTFTILNVYEGGRLPLYHMDMYRIESADELYETGVEDYLSKDGVTVIEWNKLENLEGEIFKISITAKSETEREFVYQIVENNNKL